MAAESNVIQLPNAPTERMAAELLKALVDEVKHAPAQWSKLTEIQQEGLINRLRETVRTETAKAIFLVAGGKRDVAHVKIESLTAKEGVKCVLQVGADAQHEVLDYVGQRAVLVMCDPEQFLAGLDEIKAEKDQQVLPLEGGAVAEEGQTATAPLGDVQVGDDVRFLAASPDGLVRKVRAVNRDLESGRTTIEVTGLPDEFDLSLFEAVVTDPIAEVEADDAAEAAAEEDRMAIDVDDETDDETEDDEAAALAADAAEDESRPASGGKKRRRRA